MEVIKAIFQRRATRSYSDAEVTPGVVRDLLHAATMAPSALNQQPWAFAVIHGRDRLRQLSDRAKQLLMAKTAPLFGLDPRIDQYGNAGFNLYHDADTLIVVFAKLGRNFPMEECMLAAQNLMLAACGYGLATCPVGFTRPWFDLPEVKAALGISSQYSAVLPIVVGYPLGPPQPAVRAEPEIACWIWDESK